MLCFAICYHQLISGFKVMFPILSAAPSDLGG